MAFQDFIKPELLLLVPVLYLVGAGLKKSTLPDKRIPLVLGAIAIALSALWVFSTCECGSAREVAAAAFTAITQGILAAGASVYANQIVKQSKKDK